MVAMVTMNLFKFHKYFNLVSTLATRQAESISKEYENHIRLQKEGLSLMIGEEFQNYSNFMIQLFSLHIASHTDIIELCDKG